jgi:hypothetical protein
MKPPSDLELMLYSDGELDAERARCVRLARLCRHEVGARLDGIERLGHFVRDWAELRNVDALELRRQALRSVERRRAASMVAAVLFAMAGIAEPTAGTRSFELALASNSPVTVEAVDFGERAGSLFVVDTGSSVTPVVWLEDGPAGG